ncbi:rhomboid family intramembrane serine protease GlpG [Thalassotalea aquiviva]|uniref:rhomboid family intramembrane serine protease GlpG n=1 Tax=Thalassotalea aquiviva TaxID=3242415 RepID=UPI00352B319F
MVPFVHIPKRNVAVLFSDYLNSIGIKSTVQPYRYDDESGSDEGWSILCEQEQVDTATSEFEHFIRQPNHPKYQQSAWHSSQPVELGNKGHTRQSIANSFVAQAGVFTISIFALCWVVFAVTWLYNPNLSFALLMFNQGDIAQTFSQPWRFFTPALFHFSLLHIAFNTMWWWQLGGMIEKQLSMSTIVWLFVLSALLSNSAQFVISGPNFGGLSGVVYAVLGFVWWYGYLRPSSGIELSKSIIGFMLFWLLLGFTDFMPINVANTAHLVGLLTGIGYAFYVYKRS